MFTKLFLSKNGRVVTNDGDNASENHKLITINVLWLLILKSDFITMRYQYSIILSKDPPFDQPAAMSKTFPSSTGKPREVVYKHGLLDSKKKLAPHHDLTFERGHLNGRQLHMTVDRTAKTLLVQLPKS